MPQNAPPLGYDIVPAPASRAVQPAPPPGYDLVPAPTRQTAQSSQPSPVSAPAASISAYQPSIVDRVKQVFTSGIPSLSSRTVYDPKYGQQQLLTPEAAFSPMQQTAHPIMTGAAEVAGSLSSPSNIALLGGTAGLGEAAPMLSKLLSLGFAAQMGQGSLESGQQAIAAYKRGDIGEAERLATHALLGAGLTATAAMHGFSRDGSPLPKDRPAQTPDQKSAMSDALSNFIGQLPNDNIERAPQPKPAVPRGYTEVAPPKPEPVAPVVGQPNVAAKVDASAKPELTKAAKIEQATVSPTNTSWTAAEFDNLIMRARAVQLNPKATIEERSVASSMEATLREQQSSKFPQPEQPEAPADEPQPVTGAQPTQLKPGDELPRPLGQSIKSELPPRTVASVPAEVGDERTEPEPGVTYGEPEEPVKTAPIAKPVERPRVPKATASPNELPPGLQQILDKLENNRSRQAIPGRPEQALIGDRNERQYLESKRTELTDNYARLLKERSYDASAVVKAKSQGLSEKITYLESHLEKRDQIENFKAAAKEALSTGYETTPTGEESGLKRHIESQPLAVREAIGEALGNRRVDVPNRLYAKRVQTALSKGEEVPSDEASPELLQLKRQYEDLKERVKDAVKLTGAMPDEDDVAKLKTLESKLVLGALRSHGHPKIADVAVAKGVPVADVASTGAGKAVDIKHGGLPVMTQQIWEREYGGPKGKALPTVDQLQDKLAELKDSKSHLDAMAARLDYFADAFKKSGDSGAVSTRVALGLATGTATGAVVGTVVGGPIGGLVGSALGMASGGITSAFDLHAAFPTVYDRLSEFARGGSSEEDLTEGLKTQSSIRMRTGEEAQRNAQYATQVKELNKRVDKQWTAQQGLDYMTKAARGNFPLSKDEQSLHDVLHTIYEPMKNLIENLPHGSYNNWLENYFPGMYKKPGQAADWLRAQMSKRPLSGPGSFRREKVFADVGQAIGAGLQPITTNPVAMTLAKLGEMNKYYTGHRILSDLKEQGIAKFFSSNKDVPPGWRKFDDRIADSWRRGDKGERILNGSYYGPPDAVKVFNDYVSPGIKGLGPGWAKGADIVRAVGSAENQFQLGFSAFHMMTTSVNAVTSDAALGLQQLTHGDIGDAAKSFGRSASLVGSIYKTYTDGYKAIEEYLSPGKHPAYRASVEALTFSGGRVGMDEMYTSKSRTAVLNAKKEGRYAAMVARAPFAGIEWLASPIMERIVPTMKVGIFHGMASDILEQAQRKGWTDVQTTRAMDRAWDSVDNRFGQVVYNNIFVNKVAKDVAFLSVRSAGWTGGTIRELGGAALDATRAAAGLITGDKPELSNRVAYAVALTATTAYLGALYTYGHTGHLPTSIKNYWQLETGRVGADGRKEYMNLASYMKDVFAYEYQPGATLLNKAQPLLHNMVELYQNKDYYGTEIVHPDDPLHNRIADYVKYVAKQFIPFSLLNAEHRVHGGLEGYIESGLGVTPAPRYATMSPAEQTLFYDNSRSVGGTRTTATFEHSQLLSDIEESVRSNNDSELQRLVKQGVDQGILARNDLAEVIKRAQKPYFQSAAERASLEDLTQLYATNKPSAEELDVLKAEIMRKFGNGQGYANKTPEQQKAISEAMARGNELHSEGK